MVNIMLIDLNEQNRQTILLEFIAQSASQNVSSEKATVFWSIFMYCYLGRILVEIWAIKHRMTSLGFVWMLGGD
jgi:hypothetical protein